MDLTDEEQAKVNAEFIKHWAECLPGGTGAQLPIQVKVTRATTHALCKRGDDLTIMEKFAMITGLKLICTEEQVARMCNEWADKHTVLLHNLEQARKGE